MPAAEPELVVVFEVLEGTTDLHDAFDTIGLDLVLDAEDDIDDEAIPDNFERRRPPTAGEEPTRRYLHAAMANQAALDQLLALWRHWQTGRRMPNGTKEFRVLFDKLVDVHPWGPADRIRATGLAERLSELQVDGAAEIPVNIELWFRRSDERRRQSEQVVRAVVAAAGGRVLDRAERREIGYHAIAAVVPSESFGQRLSDPDQVALLRAPDVLFVRPAGQGIATEAVEDPLPIDDETPAAPLDQPLVGVLDGLPEANHPLLRDRVLVVDSDDYASDATYTSERRRHGTSVASIVIWGDRGANHLATDHLVAVRPIMKPDPNARSLDETIPWDQLPPDLTIRAVQDLVQAAPSIRIINISLGDPLAQFDTTPTSWARAVDWLAFEHGLLFIISAGNHGFDLPIDPAQLSGASGDARNQLTAEALAAQSTTRRLLSPAESLNAITVGALHADAAGSYTVGYRIDPWDGDGHPAPTSALGRGIRRSVKPELTAPGGRQLYNAGIGRPVLSISRSSAQPPGIRVAAPPNGELYQHGTTYAAGEVSRQAARIVDGLLDEEDGIDERYLAVAAKALLAHGARHPWTFDYGIPSDRMFGLGPIVRDLGLGCTSNQATLLFLGDLAAGEGCDLIVPLPNEVGGRADGKRITTTLAWMSPINWNHRQYRQAKLTVDGPAQLPTGSGNRTRLGLTQPLTRRGTLEHREFEAHRAVAATELVFKVKCAGQAGGFDGAIPFAAAFSIEVAPELGVDVYQLVRDQLQTRVRVR